MVSSKIAEFIIVVITTKEIIPAIAAHIAGWPQSVDGPGWKIFLGAGL